MRGNDSFRLTENESVGKRPLIFAGDVEAAG
jgi:hypothetical protein